MRILEPTDISVLLLAEDLDTQSRCRNSLLEEGYQVEAASSMAEAKKKFKEDEFHILFVDLAELPGSGLEFCQWVRRHSTTPIVALTNRTESVTEEMALDAGADDYIVKPLTKKQTLMRITQQLNRSGSVSSRTEQTLHFQNLTLGLSTHKFTVNESVVSLTATEFLIVRLFMKEPKRVFTREQILAIVGTSEGPGTDHIINSHISRLRTKIRNSGGPKVISVIRKMGYKFSNEVG